MYVVGVMMSDVSEDVDYNSGAVECNYDEIPGESVVHVYSV